MKRKKTIFILAAVLVLILVLWWLFFRKKEQPVALETEKPQTGYISESVTATGTVQPVDTTAVGSRVSGTIEEMYADYNSVVKKGQLLAVLDPSLMQATVDQTKAALTEAKSNRTYQESNFNRQKQLYQTGSISRAEFELTQNSYNVAKANVRSIEAQLYSAERNLSFTKIYAPVDGVVLRRTVSLGQTVAASFNTPTLFTIAKDITKMQVQAAVDEADIGDVTKGQRASFTVDAYLNDTFNGTVEEIRLSPSVSSNVVTYTTIVNAPNEDKKLKPGMTANITIYTKEVNDALLIPAKALKFAPDSSLAGKYEIVPLERKRPQGGENGGQSSSPRKAPAAAGTAPANSSSQAAPATAVTSAAGSAGTEAFVWTLQGNKLIQKKILTGLNNNTQVEVLEGLSADDVLAIAIQTGAAAVSSGGAASSPFMPKPPGRRR